MSTYLAKSHATQALSAKDTNEKLNFIARAIYELARTLSDIDTKTDRIK